MNLSEEQKKILSNIVVLLEQALAESENAPTDYRAQDAIDIAISLLMQQIESGQIFEVPPQDDTDEDGILELDDESFREIGQQIKDNLQNAKTDILANADFMFFNKQNSPEVDELKEWFDLPSEE